jgi:hypothetical protein
MGQVVIWTGLSFASTYPASTGHITSILTQRQAIVILSLITDSFQSPGQL